MKKVFVYVEGPSDKLAMEALLGGLIDTKREMGIDIEFFEAPSGHKKQSVLLKVPRKAVEIIRNYPDAIVVALPDLYPKNIEFPHETIQELRDGVMKIYDRVLDEKGIENKQYYKQRFFVHCFKHDFESLILASEAGLKARLGIEKLDITWSTPVEDQNHGRPPKSVVEELFSSNGKKYKETIDAPVILRSTNYKDLGEICDQGFKPFVEFIEGLL